MRSTLCSRSSQSDSGSQRSCSRRLPCARSALPWRGVVGGVGAGALLATAYGLQTAGLDLTTVSSTGFITGLYVVLTPIIALALFRTPVAAVAWVGVALAVAGLLLLNGVPGGSALGNALVLGNAVAQSFQIVAMERFAPRYDARALTFLQMAVACLAFTVIAASRGELSVPGERDGLVRARRHGRLRRGARLSRRDLGAVAHHGGAGGARVHARGAVRSALRRRAPVRAPRLRRLGGLHGDARRDPRRRARGRLVAASPRRPARACLMDAVVLALCSAALFGGDDGCSPTGARRRRRSPLRCPLHRPRRRRSSRCALRRSCGDWNVAAVWPFALAGILGPGVSQVLFTLGDPRRRPFARLCDGRDGAALRGHVRRRPARRAARRRRRPRRAADRQRRRRARERVGRPEHVKTIGLVFALAARLCLRAPRHVRSLGRDRPGRRARARDQRDAARGHRDDPRRRARDAGVR